MGGDELRPRRFGRRFPATVVTTITPRRDDEFRFAIRFDDDRPVVSVVGEVTPVTAPTVAAVVTGLADHGHRQDAVVATGIEALASGHWHRRAQRQDDPLPVAGVGQHELAAADVQRPLGGVPDRLQG